MISVPKKTVTPLVQLLFVLFHVFVNAQEFNPRILLLPENPEAADFSFLQAELRDAQVVMLGEYSHSDGNVFELKIEIIEFLYREMGFRTVAFESGVFDVWHAQKEIQRGTSTREALRNSLFPIWSDTKEFAGFIDFYDRNKNDVKLVGFDNQTTGPYGEQQLFISLFAYCSQNGLTLNLDRGDLELLMESIYSSNVFDENDITYNAFQSAFQKLLKEIARKPKSDERYYWTQIIESLLSIGEDCYRRKDAIASSFYTSSDDNIRDKQMADNLLAYLAEHPNEKIICWGANQHFANDMSTITVPVIKDFVPMGSYIKKALNEKVYSLAAVTSGDSIFLNKQWHKTPITKDSFEAYLKNQNQSHVFISSQQNEMQKALPSRLFSPNTFVEANLSLVHDGYLYYKDAKPATFVEFERNAKNAALPSTEIDTANGQTLLEVTIKSRKVPYSIVRKAIDKISANYPFEPFSSKFYSNIDVKAGARTLLDVDFIANQYDLGYGQTYRSTKQIREIRWNMRNGYEPKSIQSEFYRTYIHNPIMYGRFLNIKKFKKFVFTEDDSEKLDGIDVFVIHFTTLRDQFSYTDRSYFSDYSGTLYINQHDYAIVKINENWNVTGYRDKQDQEYQLSGWPANFTKREVITETCETTFSKYGELYFITKLVNRIVGNLHSDGNVDQSFEITVNSIWDDFKTANPEKISLKNEQNLFDKVSENPTFWKGFTLPE